MDHVDDGDFGVVLEEEDEVMNAETVHEIEVIENHAEAPTRQLDPVFTVSKVPLSCENGAPCCVGIDEAGRGPVLGPMVYGAAYWALSDSASIEKLGFNDSKQLTEEQRKKFFQIIEKEGDRIGHVLCDLSAEYLSIKMLQRHPVSLNEISYVAAIDMIKKIVASGVHVAEIYVDAVGNCERYAERLQQEFPGAQIVVKPKADALYKVVGAASIFAKVTRDEIIKNWKFAEHFTPTGNNPIFNPLNCSGYPGDEKTVRWLKENSHPVFGFPSVVRFSWKTTKNILGEFDHEMEPEELAKVKANRGTRQFINVEWENMDPDMQGIQTISSFMAKSKAPKRTKYFSDRSMQHVTVFN